MKTNISAPPGESDSQGLRISRKTLWIGRILSALPVLFLLMDGIMKLVKPEPVVKATIELGYPESVIIALGVILLVCVILYLVPRTAVLGAILLTVISVVPSPRRCASAIPCSATSYSRSIWRCLFGAAFSSAIHACVHSFR